MYHRPRRQCSSGAHNRAECCVSGGGRLSKSACESGWRRWESSPPDWTDLWPVFPEVHQAVRFPKRDPIIASESQVELAVDMCDEWIRRVLACNVQAVIRHTSDMLVPNASDHHDGHTCGHCGSGQMNVRVVVVQTDWTILELGATTRDAGRRARDVGRTLT